MVVGEKIAGCGGVGRLLAVGVWGDCWLWGCGEIAGCGGVGRLLAVGGCRWRKQGDWLVDGWGGLCFITSTLFKHPLPLKEYFTPNTPPPLERVYHPKHPPNHRKS